MKLIVSLTVLFSVITGTNSFISGRSRFTSLFTTKQNVPDKSNQCLQSTVTDEKVENFKFESNVARVMDIIINSLYSNKDVFIRELISNAADACDKKRFLSLTDGKPESSLGLGIRVYANREKNTLTIEDRGIGMNKADLIQNLGRIAESGTKKFMEALGKDKDAVSLIGQFGVGFYSGFLVADKMEVITKGSEGEQLKWVASADTLDQYTITKDDAGVPIETTGTRIILHLKDESDQYLDDVALRSLIEKYSEFIPFPIE
jgi:heat shock protein beta